MKTTEGIIADCNITNGSDAALIRLVGQATAMAEVPVETLLQRTTFSNAADATLAKALVETVRANSAKTTAAKANLRFGTVIITLVLGIAVLGAVMARVMEENGRLAAQLVQRDGLLKTLHEGSAGQLAQLQNQTTAANRENVQTFTETIQHYMEQTKVLQEENTRLRLELAQAKKAAPTQ